MKKIYSLALLLFLCMLCSPQLFAVKWTSYKICIDPGHGGSDPGALGPSAPHEGTLALRCALALRDKLQSFGAPVGLTRTTDATVSLTARRNYFLNQDPWIALSIHLNAFNGTAHGTETWYYWTTGNSKPLADKMQAALVSQLKRANRGVKQNGWTVITASSNIPSVLTEGLFVDNRTEWDMINANTKAGFQAWVNGHLYGCYDHLVQFNGSLDNPRVAQTNPTITVSPASLSFSCPYNETRTATFSVSGKDLTSNIAVSSSSGNFTVSPTSLSAGGGTVTVTFRPSSATTYSGTITVKSGSVSKTVSVSGTGQALAEISLSEKWNISQQRGNLTSKGWDASKVRNMAYGYNGKLYLVYEQAGIKVIESQTGNALYDLNKTNVSGGTLTLCDVRICDGKVVACNLSTGASPLKVYVWDSDTSSPRVVLQTTNLGGATRLGDYLGFMGTWASGRFVFAHDDGTRTRIVSYAITNGVCSTTPTVINATTDGSTRLACSASVRIIPDASGYWINGKDNPLTRLDTSGKMSYQVKQANVHGNGFSAFTYNGTSYAVLSTFNGSANYTGGCMELINATDGWANAKVIGQYPGAGLGSTPNTNCTGNSIAYASGNGIEAWVLSSGQGIAYFTYGSPSKYSANETLGIDLNGVDQAVSVYASNRMLYIDGVDVSAVDMYSLTGQKVISAKNVNEVPLYNINGGVYIAVVVDIDGNVIKKKVFVE
ncbi:MAG: N-acetylmuramoyl-L-alanine amidase [Dysgonomonas sp.]